MTQHSTVPANDRFITLQQLRDKLAGRARSSIYLDIENNRLPKPMKLGGTLYWSENAVNAAMAELQAA
ncbi:AlpA family transcriptional regulator [Sulfitobacter sp. 20_GPM-1509m]|uniref:helix-turn-helix transcriptional regulator n=1 Tax=Sulfitobacter sp. 20_GPM-1509m TaxID=1380367 RepID=UPI0005626AB4|nr:AlpA family phage regulatory protein [Sulfitobacter sp. 20_GPM-1509m]